MSTKKGFNLFKRKEKKSVSNDIEFLRTSSDISILSPKNAFLEESPVLDIQSVHEMTNERFQELLNESRRWKSEWIGQAREESEVNLWDLLKSETNILKLTNCLHPNKNQLVRLGTQIKSTQIIPPALSTLSCLVFQIRSVKDQTLNDKPMEISSISSNSSEIYEKTYCESVVQQMVNMSQSESEKMSYIDNATIPQGVSIDANEATNEFNQKYEAFLEWLKDTPNHECYVRIKKFITSINAMLPKNTSGEREIQSENLNLLLRSFSKEVFNTITLPNNIKLLYQRFIYKFLTIMCYKTMMSCLPSYKANRPDFFLDRCKALSKLISFEKLGHDNRHTVSQYKEFWDCAIQQLQVMVVYRNVADKVICLNNAINILTRLLETIFKVVGADELMDGICIVVIKACVPQLKLQLQLIDIYYEEEESKRGIFESVKLRIRGIIAFVKNCRYSDFTKLSLHLWEETMGKEGNGLSRHRRNSELSSDDEPSRDDNDNDNDNDNDDNDDNDDDDTNDTPISTQQSMKSNNSLSIRGVFGNKMKKIVDGKWRECLDPLPLFSTDDNMNDRLVKQWKQDRYKYYKDSPTSEKDEVELLKEYRNVVRTVENLLYLVRK